SGAGSQGTLKVHHSLTPTISASFWGFRLDVDASQYLGMVEGSSFHYNLQGQTKLDPWGFTPASTTMPAPSLDQSTIFATPLPVDAITDGIFDLLGGFVEIDSVNF